MKPEELFIGAWMQPKNVNAPFQVCSVESEGLCDTGNTLWCSDEIEPIPITEEILKKNGFKDGQFFAELYIQGWHVMSDAHNLCMKNERGWHMDIQCEFVHQLQHALRLCGINKEIEL